MRELLPQLTQTDAFTSRSPLLFARRKALESSLLPTRTLLLFGLALDIKSQNPEQRMSPRIEKSLWSSPHLALLLASTTSSSVKTFLSPDWISPVCKELQLN
jgi:hypothetical protein